MTSPGGVCADCGATGQGGSFCDRCGAVLNWTPAHGVPLPPAAEPPAAERPVEPPDSASSTRIEQPHPPRPAGPPPPPPPAGRGHPPAGPPAGAAPDRRVAPLPQQQPPPARDDRARRLIVPVTPQSPAQPPPGGPAPVLPGRPEAARPQSRARSPEMSGGVPCPWCDTPNPPDRHFCRQCAMPLASADKDGFRTRTWWQRLVHGDRNQPVPWAGERPRVRRGPGNLLTVAVLAVAGVAVVGTAVVKADDVANGVVDHFVKRAPVSPNAAKASHTDPKHGPQLAVDGLADTFWGTGFGGGSQGVFLEASFVQPRRLLNVIITPGVSKQPDQYATQARPQILDARIFSSDGKSTTRELRLDDAPGPQKLKLRGDNVVKVRLTIRSAYGTAQNRQVCIAEVEFFTRSTVRNL